MTHFKVWLRMKNPCYNVKAETEDEAISLAKAQHIINYDIEEYDLTITEDKR